MSKATTLEQFTHPMRDGEVSRLALRLRDAVGFRTLEEREAIAEATTSADHKIFRVVPGFAARGIARRLHKALRSYGDPYREVVRRAIIEGSESDLWKHFAETGERR